MRNLNVHRARLTRIFIQRRRGEERPQIIIFTATPFDITEGATFDLHLRRRPDLPDIQDLITAPTAGSLFLEEIAPTTLHGVLQLTNGLLRNAAETLLRSWRTAEAAPEDFPPPGTWDLEAEPDTPFEGFAPGSAGIDDAYDSLRGHPETTKRLVLAERLR